MDEDIWEDDVNEVEYEKRIHSNEAKNLQLKFNNLGIREGIINNKTKYNQEGFDLGFKEGIQIGSRIGNVYGISWLLKEMVAKKKIDAQGIDTDDNTIICDDSTTAMDNKDQKNLKLLKKIAFKSKLLNIDQLLDKEFLKNQSSIHNNSIGDGDKMDNYDGNDLLSFIDKSNDNNTKFGQIYNDLIIDLETSLSNLK
ncbi:hypothetical protein K502DRAFT_345551 [Neoconidiobolus thromboides FSU 785]|nr:hypothetical protein K502DRAFT_345551 [Neoconidiobolus thromboides FSU 785]